MPLTPRWESAKNGLPGNLNATNHAAQVDQLLGTHAVTPIYSGSQLIQSQGGTNFTWLTYGSATDLSQPFTLPGGHTSIGRVTIPVQPIGNGADLLVSLYPDNGSGSPNTSNLLASTSVPSSWINQLSAVNGLGNGGPLATAAFNTYYFSGGVVTSPWAIGGSGSTGIPVGSATTTSGNYAIFAGGAFPSVSTPTGNVETVSFLGTGSISLGVAQPSIPVPVNLAAMTTTSTNVIVVGGVTTVNTPSTATPNVWTASWDANTGAIGSWNSQSGLPSGVFQTSIASSGNNVFVVGGINSSNAVVSSVYFASLNNGQISFWNIGQPLPTPLNNVFLAAINGWLIAAGGDTSVNPLPASSATYYAKILTDGSLGPWLTGPSMPVGMGTFVAPGSSLLPLPNALVTVGGMDTTGTTNAAVQVLPVSASGLGSWYLSQWAHPENLPAAAFPGSNGSWDVFTMYSGSGVGDGSYEFSTLVPAPTLSVPLPATGLTGGATYHVVLQQRPSQSTSDYLQYGINSASLSADAKKSARHSGTWTTAQSGYSVPIGVYDNTVGGTPIHMWHDPSSTGSSSNSNLAAFSSTFAYDQYRKSVGILEAVVQPNDPMNINPTFTSGVANWTPHNCTFVQSNAQVHGGFPFSGLMTPNGSAPAPNVTSELEPIPAFPPVDAGAQWYTVNGWFYSPTGWSTVSASVDWYNSNQVYISTTSTTASLSAATWTNLVSYNLAPAGAAFASINIVESGTPAASNTLYFSNVGISAANEMTQTLSTVSQVTYSNSGVWPPAGTTQLA